MKWLALGLLLGPLLSLMGMLSERGAGGMRAGVAIALTLMAIATLMIALIFQDARKVEQDRVRRDAHLRQFADSAGNHATYLLDTGGNVTGWNDGAQRIKGYTAADITGGHFGRFFTEEDRQADEPESALRAATRDGRAEVQGWRVRKDGSRFPGQLALRALHDGGGRLMGYAAITSNDTELIQQQEVLAQTRAALVQSQKMETLGKLSGGIAHDFNNLLHVIKNCVEVLQRSQPDANADARKMLEVIKRNADRAANLTQRLLAFSRIQPLLPKPINPNEMVSGVYELLQRTLGESVELQLLPGEAIWSCAVDANQLEIAILNLAINARDAMPEGGKLSIETINVELDQHDAITQTDVEPGEYVLISVSDSGTGMSDQVAAKAFEPFFTTKEEGRGTGLGLAQVSGFIKQAGGYVNLYSEPGVGTTVNLYLPRSSQTLRAEAPQDESRPRATGNEFILLIEDDPDIREFTTEVLRDLGYRVVGVSDAVYALAALEREVGVDLLFTDLGLPRGINGRQLADQARKRWPDIAVLFTTAYTRNAMEQGSRRWSRAPT